MLARSQFFISAAAAANVNVDAFKAEFAKPEADANIREWVNTGDPLAHHLIRTISDEKLPELLDVMLTANLSLSLSNSNNFSALSQAALYGKVVTVNFLVDRGYPVNASKDPVLVTLGGFAMNAATQLQIIKNLIEIHSANIDIQDMLGYTILMRVADKKHFEIIAYLLSKNPNLLLAVPQANNTMFLTALSFSYNAYISASKSFSLDDDYTKNAKACFDLLINAAHELFYARGLTSTEHEEQLLNSLSGKYHNIYPEQNNHFLKEILKERALQPAKERLLKEQTARQTFLMAAHQRQDDTPLKTAYLKNSLFDSNTAKMIFSFVHEHLPYTVNEEKDELSSSESVRPQ
ncbi:MAG: hypothetical protein P4M12_04435 [Gammaproteobacteria bacterium]|nr:hypothetical protein [Gammaproteobacteria bacterium]